MQLLEVINKPFMISSLIAVLSSQSMADTACITTSMVTQDIIICSQESFMKIDRILNTQYQELASELKKPLKPNLLSTQRSWIKLKDHQCDIYNDASYGREGPIERLSCIKHFTSFRLSEIIYLRTGVIGDGFYNALSIINKKITTGNHSKAIEYIGGQTDYGQPWLEYAQQNCSMALKLHGELTDECMARMRFHMQIN